MNRKKLDPSEAELRESAIQADKWKEVLAPDEDRTGWFTAKEIEKLIGLKSTATKQRLKIKIDQGKCEKKDFGILENGKRIIKPHYRIIE
jgi:hypothetical protein